MFQVSFTLFCVFIIIQTPALCCWIFLWFASLPSMSRHVLFLPSVFLESSFLSESGKFVTLLRLAYISPSSDPFRISFQHCICVFSDLCSVLLSSGFKNRKPSHWLQWQIIFWEWNPLAENYFLANSNWNYLLTVLFFVCANLAWVIGSMKY